MRKVSQMQQHGWTLKAYAKGNKSKTNSVGSHLYVKAYFKNYPTHRKRDLICGYQSQGEREEEVEEGGRKVESICKVITRDVMCDMMTVVNATVGCTGTLFRARS